MKSVRAMLSALVLACVAPAVVGAILRAREAEASLLDDATRHVDHANASIASELADYESNARMALVLVQQATKFREAMAAHDAAGARGSLPCSRRSTRTGSSSRRTRTGI